MKEICLKTLLPILLTFLTTLVTTCSSYTYKLEYAKGANEQEKGSLVMSMVKACEQGVVHAPTEP